MKLTYTSLACPGWTIEEVVSAAKSYGYAAIEWRLADGAIIEPDAPADMRRRLREGLCCKKSERDDLGEVLLSCWA
jgi:hypothetical protein